MPSASHRRSRSRKRRPKSATAQPQAERAPSASASPRPTPSTRGLGERPRPPWAPLPLSELFILVGAIGVIVGLSRSASQSHAPLIVGLIAVALGTFEVALREHLGGYRAHTTLLALVVVLAFHSLILFIASAFTSPKVWLSAILLPFDLALLYLCFRWLRTRFLTARHARTLVR